MPWSGEEGLGWSCFVLSLRFPVLPRWPAPLSSVWPSAAYAQPTCPDIHWIGAAGSGERIDPTADGGMGRVVYQSLSDLSAELQKDGRTMTAEAVEYPAVAAPDDDGGVGVARFHGQCRHRCRGVGAQYEAFVQRCPASKVVLAGYSQGAMVVHRNLAPLAGSPNLAAALLVADGDRLPEDPTLNLGTAGGIPERGKGAAQDWPILAHAPAPLSPAIGARTISVCDLGDAVCDYDPDAEEVNGVRAWPSTPVTASPEPRDWTGRRRCTSCSVRRLSRPRRTRSLLWV